MEKGREEQTVQNRQQVVVQSFAAAAAPRRSDIENKIIFITALFKLFSFYTWRLFCFFQLQSKYVSQSKHKHIYILFLYTKLSLFSLFASNRNTKITISICQ